MIIEIIENNQKVKVSIFIWTKKQIQWMFDKQIFVINEFMF